MKQSILAGILIGLGVIINIQLENPIMGALLFSFGLLSIIDCNLNLYTGKIAYIKKIGIINTLNILLCNFVGAALPIIIRILSNEAFYNKLLYLSNIKFSQSYLSLLFNGIMCGILIFIAVYCKEVKIITIFCVMVFILSGYEHCIADFPYLMINLNMSNILKLICVIIGNSIGAIVTYYFVKN